MNLAHLLDGHPDDHIAVVDRGRSISYGELRRRIGELRGGLSRLGIGRGDRVALLCANGQPFIETYFAVLGLGGVVVPMNPHSPAPELEREIATVQAVAAVVDERAATVWQSLDTGSLPMLRHAIVTRLAGGAADQISFDGLFGGDAVDIVDVDPDTLAVLIFTSGTAGSPRPAMLSHGNLQANIDQGRSAEARINSDDVVYAVLPMFHIFGLNVVLALTLAAGATLVVEQRFDASALIEAISDHRITVVPGAPPLWVALSNFEGATADSFASVRLALTGAAKMPEDAIRRLHDRFGIDLAEGYGLTEASPIVTSSAGLPLKVGSVGKVLDGITVRLVDDDDEDVLMGDAGEIWVKGPNVFQGYLDDPAQTARVLTDDGWLRTGDVAVTDEDGYLYLVDRAKDLIIVSGFNVYPAEVEEVIAAHPAVTEVGVAGVPDALTGESVKAWVVVRQGMSVDAEAIAEWCGHRLARYKCPAQVVFVDLLPRNAGGKLLRRALT
ncbi:MAG TPA: AMP-binding protein [Ilumatobacteraceae bacterium]|jgi:long-chain acyl-CoA synthetase